YTVPFLISTLSPVSPIIRLTKSLLGSTGYLNTAIWPLFGSTLGIAYQNLSTSTRSPTSSVGIIEPLGIQNACITKVLRTSARTSAQNTVSIVSRHHGLGITSIPPI